jgi:hypothetical protein
MSVGFRREKARRIGKLKRQRISPYADALIFINVSSGETFFRAIALMASGTLALQSFLRSGPLRAPVLFALRSAARLDKKL